MDSSAPNPSTANAPHRMWTELDDDLPAFMAEMLTTAMIAEMLEITRTCWQNRRRCSLTHLLRARRGEHGRDPIREP